MSRTTTIQIFNYTELPEDVRETIRNKFAEWDGYQWAEEVIESLRQLAQRFGGSMKTYDIDFFSCSHSSAGFDFEDVSLTKKQVGEIIKGLGTYNRRTLRGNGDCVLTGHAADETAIDAVRIAYKRQGISDPTELMQLAFDAAVKEAQEDCEYQYSDETFAEHCEANDYEFYADGRLVKKSDR